MTVRLAPPTSLPFLIPQVSNLRPYSLGRPSHRSELWPPSMRSAATCMSYDSSFARLQNTVPALGEPTQAMGCPQLGAHDSHRYQHSR